MKTHRRKPSQKDRVLTFLKERGDRGATSLEIAQATGSMRFGARIMELRKDGHRIELARDGFTETGGAKFRYWLIDEFSDQLFTEETQEAAA